MTQLKYLSRVQRPSRYLGGEINAVLKDCRAVDVRVALLFPDLYEVGMSHLGLGLLYGILNRQENLWAERVYAPAPDLEFELRSEGQPLRSLESATPLSQFDVLGVSLQYELSYTNFLNMLELGGVPLLAAARHTGDPVVVAGGPACFNPEPVAPFLDAVVLGDGEEVVLELAAAVAEWKATRSSRQELWQALEKMDGVYVPALFDMQFDREGRLREIRARGRRTVIKKRVLDDLNRIAVSPQALVPYCQIVHERLNVEIARGCTRGCRYCQAGMVYRPVRERQAEALLDWTDAALAATGYEELSLLTLSAGDYAPLPWLITSLMNRLSRRQVAVSLPSLRADTLTAEILEQLKRVRRTGLTLAPEAGTDRLRRVINKNLPEEVILSSARRVFDAGWKLLKLYFMLGLPTETSTDREAIPSLARQILQATPRRVQLHVSLGSFIPKSHTPFQWERQASLTECRNVLHEVKASLRHRQIQAKWNSAAQTWLEGVFSRGDRRLAPVLITAHRMGCRLDAWSEHLRLETWREAFQESAVDPDFYLRERSTDEVLPWDHLDSGVSREFLLSERHRAFQGLETADCRKAGCQDCGVCDHEKIDLCLDRGPASQPQSLPEISPAAGQPVRYRLTYTKLEQARWLGHLELVAAFYRSLRRSGLPLLFTEGFHPLPRVSFHGALAVGVESLAETVDVELAEYLPASALIEALNRALPAGIEVSQAVRVAKRLPPPQQEMAVYQVESPEPLFESEAAANFLALESFSFTRSRPKKEDREIDLRSLVANVNVVDPQHLELHLRIRDKNNVKVKDAMAHIFKLDEDQSRGLKILKIRTL